MQGVLLRRVYDSVVDEVQLRCAVPHVASGLYEFPGRGRKKLGYPERLLLEYQNGPLAGHIGCKRTLECPKKNIGGTERMRRLGVGARRVSCALVSVRRIAPRLGFALSFIRSPSEFAVRQDFVQDAR
jgi:hypothetical protein